LITFGHSKIVSRDSLENSPAFSRLYLFSAKGALLYQPGASPQDCNRIVNER